MTEPEPVAYMWKTVRGTIVGITLADDKNPHDGHAIPLYTAAQLHPRVKMTQAEFNFFSEHNRGLRTFEQLEERIEVDSNMKWFVRSKDKNDEGYYSFLNNGIQLTLNWVYSKDKNKPHKEAVSFDNKEQAELWTNPLTEAVQLPVEGE